MTHTTNLLNANGTFCRAAIKSAVASVLATKAVFLARWSGEPLKFWRRRVWQDAVTAVRREADSQRAAYVTKRAKITLTVDERKKLAALDHIAASAPISFDGNAAAARALAEAGIIREQATRRARTQVISRIGRRLTRARAA